MAPTGPQMNNKKFTSKGGDWKKSTNDAHGAKQKRKWVPEQKVYEGSVQEGQGFALKRKEKVKHEYNKLLRRERKKVPSSTEVNALYRDEYPEHLRHLYMAEAKKLKNEAWTHRLNRSKLRVKRQEKEEEMGEDAEAASAPADAAAAPAAADADADADDADAADAADAAEPDPEVTGGPEQTDSGTGNPETIADAEKDSLPLSNRMRKKTLKKTSYQKTKEEFEAITEQRRKKKEDYLKNSKQKEEAIKKYKDKKMEMFQMLSKKTKRGQPNLNLQMEYLLQKITQGTGK